MSYITVVVIVALVVILLDLFGVDLGAYFRIPSDSRDLNYGKYFVDGREEVSNFEDYTSHNTVRLDIAGIKKTLLKLDIVREAING